MIEEHFEESKKQLSYLANAILLDQGDLEIDSRLLAPVYQKIENYILSDYLTDLANERLENLEVYINDESEVNKYREKLVNFLRELIREKL